MYTPNRQTHDRSFSWLGSGTPINIVRVKLVLWAQTSHLSEMTQSCKWIPHV